MWESRKIVDLQNRNRDIDIDNEHVVDTVGGGREGEGGKNWEIRTDIYIYTTMCKIDNGRIKYIVYLCVFKKFILCWIVVDL